MKQILTLSLLFFSLALFTQPANDDCVGLIDLGPAPYCDTVLFNNVGATESNIGADNFPPCFIGVPNRDVWFAFSTVDTILDYRITLTGCPDPALGLDAMTNPQIAVYRGECLVDELQLLDCVTSASGELTVVLDLDNLTPNLPYFIRINDWSSTATPNEGAFKLCIEEQPPINSIDEGGSTECTGTLTDSGGPDGPYGNNENFVYTICPTTPSECINFEFQYYNVESFADEINIFDGPTTTSPLLASIDGAQSNNASNGGVCYAVSASSGCMTIQFISDGTSTFDGFLGTWECSSEPCAINQPITVDVDATPDEIVQSVVFGQSLINITEVNCANGSVGTFLAADNSDLGLEKGLLLTTGSAADAAAANFSGSTTTINNFPGDDDLDVLSELFGDGSLSNDACIVEMDVYATGNEITFEYVFGSEEYPEFVNQFNDIFAFLVSGPGITGIPQIANQLNVATLPDGTFVEINSINDGLNWEYYRDNMGGQSVIYDGLTSDSLGVKKSLTARIPTIPCNFYHLKFAIADRGDFSYDSGVFISEINGGWPEIGVNYQNGIDYLVEECTNLPDELSISIDADLDQPVTVDLVIGGTATLGVDYTLNLPSTLTFTTGSEIFTFPIQVLSDNLTEGIENITIDLVQSLTCGTATIADIVLDIHDQLEVDIFDDEIDTVIVCAASPSVQLEAAGGAVYQWSPSNIFSNDTLQNPVATIDQDQWVTVVGSLGVCTDVDSIFLDYTDVALEITPGGPITACQGDTIVLTAVNNVNNQNLVWTGFPAPTQPNNPVQVITNLPNINFAFLTATVEVGGCVVSDFVDLTFNAFDLPEIIDDITVCENTSVDLGSDVESFTTTYQWTPNLNLSPGPNVSGPVATPDVTTTYTLIANGSNGACLDTFQVTITVLPVVQIAPDTVFICLGDTATLNATNAAIPFTWGPQLFLNQINQNQVKVFPPVSTWYYTDVNATNCRDSVLVYVDSLPNLSIMAVPAKDSYCQGEEVTLISETYEPANFPGIEFMWEEPLFGSLTPDSFLNLVFQAVQTSTYVRTTTVNACTSVDSIQIEVVPVAMIEVNPPVSEICQGESVILQVSGDPGITEYTWTPAQGLNCTDCVSPTASPQVSTTYMVEAEFDGCPVGASATVNVSTGPGLLFPSQTTICLGQSIVLNNATDPNSTYVWTASDGSLNTTDPQPSVSPTQTTTYTVTATRGGCTITKEITIFIAEDFTISISPVGVLCGGDSVNLSVNAEGVSEASFQWTDEAGNPLGTGQTQGTGPLTETATFFVTVTDGGGCYSHTDSVTVEVSPVFTLTVDSPVEALQGEEVTLLANISPSGLNLDFTWTDNQGMVIGTDPSVIVSSCNTTIYSVLVSDDNGCSQTASVTLNVFEGFSIDTLTYENVTLDSSGVYEGQEVVLIAITTPPNLTGATYNWFINNELVSTTNAPMSETVNAPEVDENTLFDISVLITSQAGCQISKLDTMTVLNNPVQVPNAFSPNGDGDNDVFKPVSKAPITILKFQVWNRWGQLVFDNGNGAGGWDGKQDGEDVLSDVYIYFIQYEITGGNRGAQKPLKGDVTLLR